MTNNTIINVSAEMLETYGNTFWMSVAAEVRRQRIAAVIAFLNYRKKKAKKKNYAKKQYWVAPIFQDRQEHSFYFASIPKLLLEDLRYHSYFRMSATQFEELLTIVGLQLQKQDVVRVSITPAERLSVTLRYLASGDSMTSMTFQYLVGKTTVSNIIRETCEVLWKCLSPLVLRPVLSEDDWLSIANDFENLRDFAHCIGAIDGKHIVIQCPNNAGSTYYNYKHAHSIVLLAICDAKYLFRYVDIGAYGRRSDGGIFQDSVIGQKFDADQMNVPKPTAIAEGKRVLPYCLVGDEAFPLKKYMLRPYPGRCGLTPEQEVFNYRLSRARRMIENTFGILASQWRLFRRPIIANPANVNLMVQAIVCLHNWLRRDDINQNIYVPPGLLDEDDNRNPNGFRPGAWRRVIEDGCAFKEITRCGANMSARSCVAIRDEFCDYFNNEGAVPWQNNYC